MTLNCVNAFQLIAMASCIPQTEPAAASTKLLVVSRRCCLCPAQTRVLAPQELLFEQEKGTPVIDIRPKSEFEAGFIPGSVNVEFYRLITGGVLAPQTHHPHKHRLLRTVPEPQRISPSFLRLQDGTPARRCGGPHSHSLAS